MKIRQLEAVIQLLNSIDIDGEGMEYIINGVGMNDQMLRQLIMNNPENDVKELLEEKQTIYVMNEFEKKHPEQLEKFLRELTGLLDEYHPNIYLLDDVFVGANQIYETIREEINKKRKV